MKPNERKYYDESKVCTLNSKCTACDKDIWFQEGIGSSFLFFKEQNEKIKLHAY